MRRGTAGPGDDGQHAVDVERRDDGRGQVGGDQDERRLVRGHAGRRPARELGDEPVADVGDVPGALREVAAERLELRGDRLGGLPDRTLGHQPVVDHALLGVGDQRGVGGDRGGRVQQVGALALGAVGRGVERRADHLGRRADALGDLARSRCRAAGVGPTGGSATGSGMSTAGATTRPGLTPMPVRTVGVGACTGLTWRDLLVDLIAVWSLGVCGRQPDTGA